MSQWLIAKVMCSNYTLTFLLNGNMDLTINQHTEKKMLDRVTNIDSLCHLSILTPPFSSCFRDAAYYWIQNISLNQSNFIFRLSDILSRGMIHFYYQIVYDHSWRSNFRSLFKYTILFLHYFHSKLGW